MGVEIGDLQFGAQHPLDPSRSEERAKDIVTTMGRVVVLGASDNELRKSFRVVRFLVDQGVEVVPLPEPAGVGDVDPVPEAVIVFCKPPEIAMLASELAESKVSVIWFQEGLIESSAARLLEEAGKVVIMDRCVMRDYRRQVLGEEVDSWFPV